MSIKDKKIIPDKIKLTPKQRKLKKHELSGTIYIPIKDIKMTDRNLRRMNHAVKRND